MRPSWQSRGLGLILLASTAMGCGDERADNSPTSVAHAVADRGELAAYSSVSGPSPASPRPEGVDEVPAPSATAGRKIIYNAQVQLVTEDLAGLEANLMTLIATGKAYVADSLRSGSAGATRSGMWKVRVPVDAYDSFLKGAAKLGELVSLKADSQDVSEEFFDLEARTTAKKVEEARLLKHLTETTGKLEEILAVERELSRVRGEIERMQGRLRALGNLASLATVTINASEIKGYVPPQAPTLGTRLARTFAASLETLRQLGETLLIACVALAPWLPFLALGVGLVVLIARRLAARPGPPDDLIPAPPSLRG